MRYLDFLLNNIEIMFGCKSYCNILYLSQVDIIVKSNQAPFLINETT